MERETNEQFIKSMTSEELAAYLTKLECQSIFDCQNCKAYRKGCYQKLAEEKLSWLNKRIDE